MVDILKLYVICSLPLCHIKLLAGREAGPGCRGLLLSICLPSRPHTCPVASHPLPCVSHPPPTTWLTQGLDFLFLPPRGPSMTSSSSPLLPHSCLIPPPPMSPLPAPSSAFSATAALFPLPYLSPRYVVAWCGRLRLPQAPLLLLLPACFGLSQKPHLLTSSSRGIGK